MITFEDKMWEIASSCNGAMEGLLFDTWKADAMPYIKTALNEQAKSIGYNSGWTWERPFSGYNVMPTFIFWLSIKPAILLFLEENHPEAWFKPMYMSVEQQRDLGLPV